MNLFDVQLTSFCLLVLLFSIVIGRYLAHKAKMDYRPLFIEAFDTQSPVKQTGELIINILVVIFCYRHQLWFFLVSSVILHFIFAVHVKQLKTELAEEKAAVAKEYLHV